MKISLKYTASLIATLAISFACAAQDVKNQNVELTELHIAALPNGLHAVVGIGQNISGHVIKSNFTKINLLQNGVIVGDTIDGASNIQPNQKWKFMAPINDINGTPDAFTVTEISSH